MVSGSRHGGVVGRRIHAVDFDLSRFVPGVLIPFSPPSVRGYYRREESVGRQMQINDHVAIS